MIRFRFQTSLAFLLRFKIVRLGNQRNRKILSIPPGVLARIIHECRREAFETEAHRSFSPVRPTQAYWQSDEEAERE